MSAEVSKLVRKALKEKFAGIKFSVRTPHWGTVYVSWIDGPSVKDVKSVTRNFKAGHFNGMTDSYEYSNDVSGPTANYIFETRNFSEKAEDIFDEYNEKVIKNPECFRSTKNNLKDKYSIGLDFGLDFLIENEEKERLEEQEKYKQWALEREEENKRRKIEEEKRNAEISAFVPPDVEVLSSPEIVESVKFARLNKNDTIAEYRKLCREDGFDYCRVLVTERATFKDSKSFKFFKINLLTSFPFVAGKGGNVLLESDPRYKEFENLEFFKMNEEQIEYFRKNNYRECIEVVYNDEKFWVDPQGYDYARYVGLKGI